MGTGGPYLEGKHAGAWSCTSTLPTRLHGVVFVKHRDKLTEFIPGIQVTGDFMSVLQEHISEAIPNKKCDNMGSILSGYEM